MEFFKNLLNISSFEAEINKGEFETFNQLALQITNLEKGETKKYIKDNVKPMPKQLKKQQNSVADTFRQLTSDVLEERGIYRASSKFTVFGPNCHMVVAGAQHSPSGISPKYLNEKGLINDKTLQDTLFAVCPQAEVVKARMVRMVNNWAMSSMYDNATALIFRFIQMYEKLRLDRLTTKRLVPVTISMSNYHDCKALPEVMVQLHYQLTSTRTMGAVDPNCPTMYMYANEIISWKNSIPKPQVAANGLVDAQADSNYKRQKFTLHIEAYDCHSYNDGHNISGKTFFTEAGFLNGLVLREKENDNIEMDDAEYTYQNTKVWGMMDEKAIDGMLKARAYINVDNFSNLEYMILQSALNKNVRNTPFLIDQNLQIVNSEECIYFMSNIKHQVMTANYTEKDVLHTLHKLITNHNLYEDARAAYQASLFWISQPSTETMEAQWWVTLPRMLNLPKFGLSRGAFPCLVNMDGVQITQAAVTEVAMLCAGDSKIILYSGVNNALWYWAEYMTVHNTRDDMRKEKLHELGSCNILKSNQRAIAMISALTGLSVPTPYHSNVYTILAANSYENYRRRAAFGKIDKTIIDRLNYTENSEGLTLNTLVAPGATAVVVGLGGDLLRGTPYANDFSISPLEIEISKKGKYTRRTNFFNLWALNVVSRWNGYDVQYRPSGANFNMISYAANNVALAVPPMSLIGTDFEYDYEVGRIAQRERVFGTNIFATVPLNVQYSWIKGSVSTQRYFGFETYDSSLVDEIYMVAPEMMAIPSSDTTKTTALVAQYDPMTSVFQVSQVRIAQPLPTTINRLALYDTGELQEE